jgi:hypothetical protein
MASGMAPRNPQSFFARLPFRRGAFAPALLALGLAACGFGDDRPLPSGDPDAPGDAPPDGPPIDTNPPPAMAKILEVRPNPPTPIPDDDAVGVGISFTVSGVTVFTGLEIMVDVKHTFVGDVVVELLRQASVIKTLRSRTGGSEEDFQDVYVVTPAELGLPVNDVYSVRVSDRANLDIGTIELVKLTFKVD